MSATPLILSGIPGKMCAAIANLLQEPEHQDRFTLAPFGLAYSMRKGTTANLGAGIMLRCEPVEALPDLLQADASLRNAIVIDYSTPKAALDNVRAYISSGLSFVMGTTGFDREEAVRLVRQSSTSAVIAPNMSVPIVMLQSALNHVAEEFPNCIEGYTLAIHESHQATKKDPSGTAKSFLVPLRKLGCETVEPEIDSIRDPEQQKALGVPEDHLRGHGWHWYEARSITGDVTLELSTRINGRRVYAEGTLRAVDFLESCTRSGLHGGVYSMTDVLNRKQ